MAFNILVADDSETMRTVVKKTVTMSGVPVADFYEAANGKEALKILEETWVDVILSDINMPEMNGVEMLREIARNEVFKQIPVIFITTEASQARIDETKELGAAGYVKKPFLPETIRQILTEVLEKAYEHRMKDVLPEGLADEAEDDMDF